MYEARQNKEKVSRTIGAGGTRQRIKMKNDRMKQKTFQWNDSNKQVKQLINIETVPYNSLRVQSQLLPLEYIDRNYSVVSFVKASKGVGHARILLEHVDNNRFRNFLIELEANASSHSESDVSWMPSVISSGRLSQDDISNSNSTRNISGNSAAASEIEIIIKLLPNISRPNQHEAFLIPNGMANSILSAAELLRQNQDMFSYRALVNQIGGFSMNCASFVELIAQSAGMVDVETDNNLHFKTPTGMINNLGPH